MSFYNGAQKISNKPMMRDREIIQPKVLQGLGWTIVRLWQEDFFRHPEVTILQIIDKIK